MSTVSKKYQVFVSSTFSDLVDERNIVMQALMELDCFPSGMEQFPAIDEEQMKYIQKVIDECDYYLILIGGRYGSISAQGFSYTEQEYDYAIKTGKKVLAFLHEDMNLIPVGKTDQNDDLRKKLELFKEKVKKGRLVKFWKNADQLSGLVATSLPKFIKTYPSVGWVRGDSVVSSDLLRQLNTLLTANKNLDAQLAVYMEREKKEIAMQKYADLDDEFEFYLVDHVDFITDKITWRSLFKFISKQLGKSSMKTSLLFDDVNEFLRQENPQAANHHLHSDSIETISTQFQVLGLIYEKVINGYDHIALTDSGRALKQDLYSVKKQIEENKSPEF